MRATVPAKLLLNVEYEVGNQLINVRAGETVNFCEDTQSAYVTNEKERFHCSTNQIEIVKPLKLVIVANHDRMRPEMRNQTITP